MKARWIMFCALVLTTGSTCLHAQKTEVTVRQGKVVAETPAATVSVDAGQKAVLKKDVNPLVTVDNPLVQDALELYKLVEAERAHGELKIDSVFVMVGKAGKDGAVAALYWEVPNPMPQATNIMTIPYSSSLGDTRVYDLSGNLCKVEQRSLGDFAYSFSIHFSRQVQPGENFKFIAVTRLDDIGSPVFPGGTRIAWKEGPLAYFRVALGYPNALQYFRFILPESAILVDTNRQVVATDTVDGHLTVTMRNYTGPYSDALSIITLLDPAEDGTTLADIPGKYRGLRNKRDKENAEMYQRDMHKIRAGIEYTDQSTPLTALLTILGAAINGDTDLYGAVAYTDHAPDQIQGRVENSKYWADQLDILSIPPWPDNPANGYVHPIHLCRKGSLIDELVQRMVYQDGRWYAYGAIWKQPVDSEQTTSQDLPIARGKGYLCDWEVAGPYVRKGKTHKELFDIPLGPELPDVDVPWHSTNVEPHEEHPASVDISSALSPMDQSVAYLRTEIASDRQKPARLEIYTDDGVKAWLNGELVHESNNSRGILEQPDAVNVTLKQGVNHLMLKVTEDIWGSRAIVRIGADKAAGPRPADRAIHPDSQVKLDWTPAIAAQSHRVYFGTDQDDLSLLAEISEVRQLQPLSLEENHRYYWRVDEVLADGSSIQGDVWSFTTGPQVARWTFDGDASDQSIHAFHGTLHGNPRWVPGVSGQAVALEEDEDYVIIPPMNLNTDTITMTLWVRTEDVIDNPGLVFARAGTTTAGLWFNASNNLRYNWNDDRATWLWDSHLVAPNRTWTFAALVVDPERASIYMHDGTVMKSATHQHGHGAAKFDGVTYIGHDPRWQTLKSAIDDVRIFNRALDATEIKAIYRETAKKP